MNFELMRDAFVRLGGVPLLMRNSARDYARHFRRTALLETLRGAVGRDESREVARALVEASHLEHATLIARLHSHPDGLTGIEADAIRETSGPNSMDHERPMPWWVHLWHCYANPFNLLLTLLSVVSYLTEDVKATIVIGSMVVLSTLLRFVQESRSSRAADRLKEMVTTTATAMRRDVSQLAAPEASRYFGIELAVRPARRVELPIRDLVPGDIVALAAGDMVPADLRVITAKDLFVSQSALTGESLPVEKFAVAKDASTASALDLDTVCFMGTNVVSGSATAIVVATGNRTYFGALAERVTAVDTRPTAFQVGVNKISWLLIRFMLAMTPLVFLLNGFTKGDWLQAFLFAISIAVGLTPEMLPMIVTATLAKGAVQLSKKKVIVKRLDAIQNFGAMDVLCTDKTGTLTQDRIVLERCIDATGQWTGQDAQRVLEYAYLNSYYQTGLKNLLDRAVLAHAEMNRALSPVTNYRKVDEIPFDFERRRMSVIVSEREDHHELICKGAVEEIVEVCSHVQEGDAIEPLTDARRANIHAVTAGLNEEGLRVVAVATRDYPPGKEQYGVADEAGLVLVGYIAFLDPPKETTAPALAALREHGVTVKVLTGDNDRVTARVCRDVGIELPASGADGATGILLGSQIEAMDDAALAIEAERCSVFAKLSPSHKERIVRVLHDRGHVVGFMGDGINDAPALRAADIGISVDSAVDIAKEAADLILLEKSLMVLEDGVLEGRRTFANMLKYIKMTASSNFGNVFSVLIASAFLPFLPMLPLQLLVQNLLYDLSQIAVPFDRVDHESLARPQTWRPEELGRFMFWFGPLSSIFDVGTFALMWFVFGANTPEHQALFQSGWFIEGLISQTLVVHLIRTRRIPFVQSRASAALIAMTIAIGGIAVVLPQSPLASVFDFEALPLGYFPWLVGFLVAYGALVQTMKFIYTRRYGWT